MGREYEKKYRADNTALEAVGQQYGPFRRIRMETVYYDGPDEPFGRRRWTLRRRMENEQSVCTLKVTHDDGSRGEWEVLCDDICKAIPMLAEAGAPETVVELAQGGLIPTCGARFTRQAKLLEVPGGKVELALDLGYLLGGGREIPFAEIEVELKEGPDSAADAFAEALAREHGLYEEPLSKFRRARALAKAK